MFAPRFRALARPCLSSAPRCTQQQAVRRLPKVTINSSIRQRRNQSSFRETYSNLGTLWKQYPYSVTTAFACIFFGACTLMYTNYVYNDYIIGGFRAFPEPVAKELRKALWYTNYDLKPKDAVKFYKKALEVAEQIGMDPFSDEILGIKIQLASLMEKIERYPQAIQVLEIVKRDCLLWVDELGSKPGNEAKRTRVLAKTVAISVKLGDLYSNKYVMEKESAEEQLIWAVETALKEQRRRQVEGVKPEEGDWISPEEIGGSMEALAHHYEEKNQHYLAAPLFLQAINLSPPSSCHTAILMNNLAISLAQQNPPAVSGQPAASRPALVSNARTWASKALQIANKIQPPNRTDECDAACAVATHNLGEFAEMDGDIVEARRRYEESMSLAKAMGFQEGIENADAALKRLLLAKT